jgi:hypothetical protein
MGDAVQIEGDALAQQLERAIRAIDTAEARAFAEYSIRVRTDAGIDASGRAFKPYSRSHARKRERQGLQTGHVDLVMRGVMLDGLRSDTLYHTDGVTLEIGYLKNLSDLQAMRLAEYHNRLGAGSSRVIREFVGLTESEADQVVTLVSAAFINSLNRS